MHIFMLHGVDPLVEEAINRTLLDELQVASIKGREIISRRAHF
jgi:hypothetical protein